MTVIGYQIHNKIINNFLKISLVEFKKHVIFFYFHKFFSTIVLWFIRRTAIYDFLAVSVKGYQSRAISGACANRSRGIS